jgi:hypothetical protein
MRAAALLSLLVLICGVAAALGYPAVRINGTPVVGLWGLAVAIPVAAAFPSAVFAWRKLSQLRLKR